MYLKTVIEEACIELKKNKIQSPVLDSEILLSKAIDKSREFILLNLKKKIQKKNYDYFKSLIDQIFRIHSGIHSV